MNRRDLKLTDAAVDALALHHARTELLEEIMNSPAVDDATVRSAAPRRSSRYLVPLAAAAAVAALATVPLWWGSDSTDTREGAVAGASDATSSATPGDAYLPILDAPGWVVDDSSTDAEGGEVEFNKGDAELEVRWKPARLYDEYVADREDLNKPPSAGEPVAVAGLPGQLWSYGKDDFTVIREVEGDRWIELRAQGLGKDDYLALIAQVRLVGLEEFEAALPDEFVTTAERPAAVDNMVDGIAGALAPDHRLSPMGTPGPDFDTVGVDRYNLGAEIAGAVACGWLSSYVEATGSGDSAAATEAVDAMATSREWPILQEMDAEGGYPEAVWEYADDMAAGRDVRSYPDGLGC